MTEEEFLEQYNPNNKMHITYKDHVTGETKKGLLIDTIQIGVLGHKYVNINNFYERAFMDEIISIKDTGQPWA